MFNKIAVISLIILSVSCSKKEELPKEKTLTNQDLSTIWNVTKLNSENGRLIGNIKLKHAPIQTSIKAKLTLSSTKHNMTMEFDQDKVNSKGEVDIETNIKFENPLIQKMIQDKLPFKNKTKKYHLVNGC